MIVYYLGGHYNKNEGEGMNKLVEVILKTLYGIWYIVGSLFIGYVIGAVIAYIILAIFTYAVLGIGVGVCLFCFIAYHLGNYLLKNREKNVG